MHICMTLSCSVISVLFTICLVILFGISSGQKSSKEGCWLRKNIEKKKKIFWCVSIHIRSKNSSRLLSIKKRPFNQLLLLKYLPTLVTIILLIGCLQAHTSTASCSWSPPASSPPSWFSIITTAWRTLMRCQAGWDNYQNANLLIFLLMKFLLLLSIWVLKC